MRVGVIQSNYIPWRGYFDFIKSVDLFVIHDDIQYTKQDWRNRNKIKISNGQTKWMTVPVYYKTVNQLICDTKIDYSTNWRKDHISKMEANYYCTPWFKDAMRILVQAFAFHAETISELNVALIRAVMSYYGIQTSLEMSSKYDLKGNKTDRLIDLLNKVGATEYVSGPAAKNYLEEDKFDKNGIKLEYKKYDYPPYQQPWGDFQGAVTVLDTIANCGRRMI